jgi:DHA3 family macrolide efflux protein-like MFS transporter
MTPLFMGSMVITMSLAGLLKEHFSLMVIYQVAAAFFVIGILVMLPMFRKQTSPEGDVSIS